MVISCVIQFYAVSLLGLCKVCNCIFGLWDLICFTFEPKEDLGKKILDQLPSYNYITTLAKLDIDFKSYLCKSYLKLFFNIIVPNYTISFSICMFFSQDEFY